MNAQVADANKSASSQPDKATNGASDHGKDKQCSSSPHHSPASDAQRKRWYSSTKASSLLDDQEEDDEDAGTVEPELRAITEVDENSTQTLSTDSSGCDDNKDLFGKEYTSEEEPEKVSGSPLARFSENISGMVTYLCSAALSTEDILLQTNTTFSKTAHVRNVSETDSLQLLTSSGPCGSASLFNSSNTTEQNLNYRNNSQESPPPPPSDPSSQVQCSDLNIQDLRQLLISDISMLLGSPQGGTCVCSNVQGWLAEQQEPHATSTGRRGARNRCALPSGQSRRVKQLWYKWHGCPDTQDPATIAARTTGMIRSFDDIGVDNNTGCSPPVDVVDCYYDSDPDTFTSSQRNATGQQRPGAIETDASFGSTGHGTVPTTPRASNHSRFPSFDTRSEPSRSLEADSFETVPSRDDVNGFDLWDDQRVKDFVKVSQIKPRSTRSPTNSLTHSPSSILFKDLTLGTITLIWHPQSKDGNTQRIEPPVSVQCWFEMGSRLENSLIHPKFMWRESYQPDIHSCRKLSVSCRAPSCLDVLTMVRILKPTELNRITVPYAKLDHSFTIKSSGDMNYLFEAKSTRERDWFVHGLKLTVARLASMIIVGDDQMFFEFFSPWNHSPMLLFDQQQQQQQQLEDDSASINKESKEEESCDDYLISKGSVEEEKGTAEKPFYLSTTKQDREDLWGKTTSSWS
jgi:hypothetical protein